MGEARDRFMEAMNDDGDDGQGCGHRREFSLSIPAPLLALLEDAGVLFRAASFFLTASGVCVIVATALWAARLFTAVRP